MCVHVSVVEWEKERLPSLANNYEWPNSPFYSSIATDLFQ